MFNFDRRYEITFINVFGYTGMVYFIVLDAARFNVYRYLVALITSILRHALGVEVGEYK